MKIRRYRIVFSPLYSYNHLTELLFYESELASQGVRVTDVKRGREFRVAGSL